MNTYKYIYFIGIGGIGMSALARYFHANGKQVAGYDRVSTPLTDRLVASGMHIHFDDLLAEIPEEFKAPENKSECLVIYTPAIPSTHTEYNYFVNEKYEIKKRAEVLGIISKSKKTIAIAGTHGKTSISTATAHLLRHSKRKCNAFLGGISKNYDTNLLLSEKDATGDDFVVVEADEYDRSFLNLYPDIAVITSVDTDHLDIYKTKDEIKKAFKQFIQQIDPNGTLIIKKGIDLELDDYPKNVFRYSLDSEADFYAKNLTLIDGLYHFDLQTPTILMKDLISGTPGQFNAENAIATVAVAYFADVDEQNIRDSIQSFSGVKRRFEFQIQADSLIYIDDYAHHPEELKSFIGSVRKLFSGKKITGIFQPHLFSRTKDLLDDFADSLNLLDELILLDIYPAREKPIEGVTSQLLLDKVQIENKKLCKPNNLLDDLRDRKLEVLLTMGAGDIDKLVEPIKEELTK